MSYQHSPPQKIPPNPYAQQSAAPYTNTGSPSNSSFAPPPAKRQRLSPDPRSPPNGTAHYSHQTNGHVPYQTAYGGLPVQPPYSPPTYTGSPANYAASPSASFNTPQHYPTQSIPWGSPANPATPVPRAPQMSPPGQTTSQMMMPPPPRPNKEDRDEKMSAEDINDPLNGSGINLKDEENYVASLWANRRNESFATNQSTSFGSGTASANNSFNVLTQGTSFGAQGNDPAFAGTLGRPLSQEEVDAELRMKRERAARALAEHKSHHLNDQFLLGNVLRKLIHQKTYEQGVTQDIQGVYVRNPDTQAQVMVNGTGTEGIVAAGARADARAESKVDPNSATDHILSIVCLATQERLRGLLHEAYGLARARQYGDHGRVVPPEFADIALGPGEKRIDEVVPESITNSQWDQPPAASLLPNLKKEETPSDRSTPRPVQTISYQGHLNATLQALAARDKASERERTKKREARKRAAGPEDAVGATSTTDSTAPAAALPAMDAPSAKLSKKELQRKKQANASSTEAQAFNQSNQTAALMAGNKKAGKYSWMTGGASNLPTNRFAKPAAAAEVAAAAAPVANGVPVVQPVKEEKIPAWGDWREAGVDGRGIQVRDWMMVLERDGRAGRALERAGNRLR